LINKQTKGSFMLPANLDYAAPTTLQEAVARLVAQPNAMVIAGSARAVIDLKMRRISPHLLIDLRKIPELYGIQAEGEGVRIGAMTTLRAILDDERIGSHYAALAGAAEASGDPQMRNMETIGSSLTYDARRSDIAPAVLALGAAVHVIGARGERILAASDFLGNAPGQGEIVTAVSLRAPSGTSVYEKFRHPATLDPVCGVAAWVALGANNTVQQCAFAVTGLTDHAVRLSRAEASLQGQMLNEEAIAHAASAAGEGFDTISDLTFSGEYRAHLTSVLLKGALMHIA
jgi:carbon-monoxide dehydrogenase medium subunit